MSGGRASRSDWRRLSGLANTAIFSAVKEALAVRAAESSTLLSDDTAEVGSDFGNLYSQSNAALSPDSNPEINGYVTTEYCLFPSSENQRRMPKNGRLALP